eukprot:TRINITY_DN7303_c0_g1_i4.p1 TRINITY_DN7303_c0_g1~~TRINITY_DN7303_c0_g1_i4.p1  ORF type:complete len:259 (-),score=35.95 TRINITY_DN7303_c0_g1_i4:67-843(-)
MAKRAEEREKARREALHRPPEPQPKVPYVKYEIDFSKNEDDDEEEEETVLVEELMSASPEEISRLPHDIQEQVILAKFMAQSMEHALAPPEHPVAPPVVKSQPISSRLDEEEIRRKSTESVVPTKKKKESREAHVVVSGEMELLGVSKQTAALANDERRLLEELEELERLERRIQHMEDNELRAIAQLSNKDAISQIFELERAAKAAADEERRLQQELAALDSYEQSSESDFDDEEAALAREEAELALLVERMQSTRA